MKKYITLLLILISSVAFCQEYKESISVVQFSAEFTKDAEVNLKNLDCNVFTYYLEKHKDYFINEEIVYLPTVLLFQNGKEIMRVDAGISLKFPEGTDKKIRSKVEELVSNKF